jgi:hypothetical protein
MKKIVLKAKRHPQLDWGSNFNSMIEGHYEKTIK